MPLVIKTTFNTLISGNLFFFKVFFRFLQVSSAISLIFAYENPSELKLCVSETDIDKTTKNGKMMLFSVQVSDRKKPTFDTWNASCFWKFNNKIHCKIYYPLFGARQLIRKKIDAKKLP